MTYSVVAADPTAGLIGIAAQSHHFGVGPAIVAMEAGVGAVAVQSYGDVSHYGPAVLAALGGGGDASTALDAAVATDRRHRRAQIGVVAASGDSAAATGDSCVQAAGHVTGPGWSAQANMCASAAVWNDAAAVLSDGADADASNDLAHRLIAALLAAEAAGGDLRGVQSAVLRIVAVDPAERHQAADIRVDDHPDPLAELVRLDAMRRAGHDMAAAFSDAATGKLDTALRRLEDVQNTYGDNPEPAAWAAVLLARDGRLDEASEYAARVRTVHPAWAEFWTRLPAARLLPDDPEVIRALVEDIS